MSPDLERLTAALLTPTEAGAVASIAVRGPGALDVVDACFKGVTGSSLSRSQGGRLLFGCWRETGEDLVVCPWSPDCVEIHCHGGKLAADTILDQLERRGCVRVTAWQDAASGRLIQEAFRQLSLAPTRRTAAILLDQWRGAMNRELQRVRDAIEAGHIAAATRQFNAAVACDSLGRHLTEPWKLVIVGRPNVGKSSLLNRLLGFERAIVHDRAGTTRDLVTANSAIDGWPVEFVDSAGWRFSTDPIETEGVRRARLAAAEADLCLMVFDAGVAWSRDDDELRNLTGLPNKIVIHNKVDLAPVDSRRPAGHSLSCRTGQGFEPLLERISRELVPEPPAGGAAVPASPLIADHLAAAQQLLAEGQVQGCVEAIDALLAASN